jgi:hypothetical protein
VTPLPLAGGRAQTVDFERVGEMITQSGVHIQTIGGAAGTPTAQDIAVHAGRLCRFGGAIWYPLLPHLVFVGLMAYRRSGSTHNLMWGFLHDAHECVTGDVPRPFKCDCMRREQSAIDARVLAQFMVGLSERLIDYALINECDHDACDIEATTLELPDYRKIATACATSYRRTRPNVIHENADDVTLFRRILTSPFNRDTVHANAPGVQEFARVLEHAQAGRREEIIPAVEAWGLL